MHVRLTRTWIAAFVAVPALVIAAGAGYAAIPDGAHVYNACMSTSTGAVRLIDPALPGTSRLSHCHATMEKPVSWNEQGRPGVDGRDGADGAPGADGIDGPPGADGKDGVDGAPGAPGAPGADGRDGIDGTNGINGTDGVNGTNGTNGIDGATGPAGPKGDPCAPTDPACVGPKGDKGDKGDQGDPGGVTGSLLWIRFVGAATPIQQGQVGVTAFAKLRPGIFRVTFDRNISSCPHSATLTSGGPVNGAVFDLAKGQIATGQSFANGAALPNSLDVQVSDSAGTPTDGLAAVMVLVFC